MKWSSGSCRPAVGRRVQTSAVGCARQSGAVGCARQSGAAARRVGAAWRVGAEAWRVGAAAWRVGAEAWRGGGGGRDFGCSPYSYRFQGLALCKRPFLGMPVPIGDGNRQAYPMFLPSCLVTSLRFAIRKRVVAGCVVSHGKLSICEFI